MALRISYKQVRVFFLSLSLGVIVFAAGYETAKLKIQGSTNPAVNRFVGNPTDGQVQGADFSKYWEVWKRLERSFVDPSKLDYKEMTYGSMQGLAQSLGDPYTQYLPPVDNKQANEDLNGSFYGVGIELGYQDSSIAVVAPLKGTPAERSGVEAGDLILHIKDETKEVDADTRGMSLTEAVRIIRGEKGVPVILTLYREGEAEPFEVTIVRDEIVVPSVELSYVTHEGKTYAHLELHRFGGRTDREWSAKVAEIMSRKPAGVVLDLRNNPGGYLDGAVYVAGEFLTSGVVVEQRGRNDSQTYNVDRKGQLTSIPLVVLVNKGSASASEITAGALQDHGRAVIVGEQTFGKGTVQEVQDLSDGSSLHVTIANWFTPEGMGINEEGIKPDVEAKDDPQSEEVDEALITALGQFK